MVFYTVFLQKLIVVQLIDTFTPVIKLDYS
jgi:hypothetical protein